MSWLHQDHTQPVLFLQPETFKIEDAAKDAATVLTLKPERMECSTGHHLKKGEGRLMSRPDSIWEEFWVACRQKCCFVQSCVFSFPELRTPDKVVTVM